MHPGKEIGKIVVAARTSRIDRLLQIDVVR
jgi:hypothetical protein